MAANTTGTSPDDNADLQSSQLGDEQAYKEGYKLAALARVELKRQIASALKRLCSYCAYAMNKDD